MTVRSIAAVLCITIFTGRESYITYWIIEKQIY